MPELFKREKECKHCGKTFQYKRSTAKFCSDSCRVRWHELKDEFERDTKQIQSIIRRMNERDKEHPDRGNYVFLAYKTIYSDVRFFGQMSKKRRQNK